MRESVALESIHCSAKLFRTSKLSNRSRISFLDKPPCSIFLQIYKDVTDVPVIYKTDRNVVYRPVDFIHRSVILFQFSYNDGITTMMELRHEIVVNICI